MNNALLIETAPPVRTDAPEQWWPTLHVKKGKKLFPATPEQLARLREVYNDGRGASEIRNDIMIFDDAGTHIGRVSYNGRVWLEDIEGDIEVPQADRPTAAQRELQGWK